MPLGIDPTVDYAFKRLFADPANTDLLLHLLRAVLPLSPPLVDVVILNPFNEKEFADDKLSVLDLKARSASGEWYNVEIQSKAHWSLRPRLAYYGASLYVDQLAAGDDYAALAPAITICFLKEILFREASAPHLQFTLYDGQHQVELTDRLQVHTIELPKYNFEGVSPASAAGLAQWAFFFSRAADLEADELKRLLPQPEFVKATGVVEMIAQTPQERLQYEARRKAELDFRSFVADARREGHEEGREQGHKLGLVEQVQLLQELLHESVATTADLMAQDNDALAQLCAELRGRLRACQT